jgi:hypothetical protein
MYSSKISSDMTINKKTGEVKINEFKVSVDGFSKPKLLEKAKESYNASKDLPSTSYASKWPEETWHEIYWSMWKNFLKWKKKRIY